MSSLLRHPTQPHGATQSLSGVEGMRIQNVQKLMPVLVPLVTLAAWVIFIKLGCVDGVTACGNVTELLQQQQQQHQSLFSQFLSQWQV